MFASTLSLSVSLTTIAESPVGLFACLMYFTIYTTILRDVDLCIMSGSCFVDLLLNEVECVHLFTPKVVGCVKSVPLVGFCVLVETLRICCPDQFNLDLSNNPWIHTTQILYVFREEFIVPTRQDVIAIGLCGRSW